MALTIHYRVIRKATGEIVDDRITKRHNLIFCERRREPGRDPGHPAGRPERRDAHCVGARRGLVAGKGHTAASSCFTWCPRRSGTWATSPCGPSRCSKRADVIACEDTRHSLRLLNHLEIRKPLVSYHEHNEARRTAELIERLRQGRDRRGHHRRGNAGHLGSRAPAAAGMHRGKDCLHGSSGAIGGADGARSGRGFRRRAFTMAGSCR